MKKILIILILCACLGFAGCGTTEEVVKDTNGDSSDVEVPSQKCGDGECEADEMCDVDTLKSGCIEDCGECPTRLYTKGFDCGSYNCKETKDNTFEIIGDSSIELKIVNLGEVLANTLEIDGFKCYVGNVKAMSNMLLANYKGYIISQKGFEDGENKIRLAARGSKGDEATYTMNFERDKLSELETPFELRCTFGIKTHSPIQGKEQTVYLNFK